MIFPDNVFKYTSNMIKHLPELAVNSYKTQNHKVEEINNELICTSGNVS